MEKILIEIRREQQLFPRVAAICGKLKIFADKNAETKSYKRWL